MIVEQHEIGDHALLGDGRTAALVDPSGNVAWLCWPRIDSPPCLLSILDPARGGHFVVAPADDAAEVVERGYVPGTLVLRTVWQYGGARLTVLDGLACDGPARLVRLLHSTHRVEVVTRVAMAPDAARSDAHVDTAGGVLHVTGAGLDLVVRAPSPWTVTGDGGAVARFSVDPAGCAVVLGDAEGIAAEPALEPTLAWFAERTSAVSSVAVSPLAAAAIGEETARALLHQGAAVLAGLRQRGGGIVAAPTTSLPQWPGGSRTWDYRYSWLRDSALAGIAMLRAGLLADAAGVGAFIGEATTALPPAVLLRVDGTVPPAETTLDHLAGYRGARPVRIGNAAATQPQLDVAGEVLTFAAALAQHDALPATLREGVARVADWTAQRWRSADHGIWEIRGEPRVYTHSRVMAWTGLVRAAQMCEAGVISGAAAQWRRAAAEVREAVLARAGPLQLHESGGGPDAALTEAILFGFVGADDPRARATLAAIETGLDRNGLLDRHDPAEDASAEPCGAFLFPTFWMAEALHLAGLDGSRHFAAAVAARGSVDLFGEVADPARRTPLGNYPQVQSHAAFIIAATLAREVG